MGSCTVPGSDLHCPTGKPLATSGYGAPDTGPSVGEGVLGHRPESETEYEEGKPPGE